MKMNKSAFANLLGLSLLMLAVVLEAAPVPVIDILCEPGWPLPTTIVTNGQTLAYIETLAGHYAVAGVSCTYCNGGTATGTTNEAPASTMAALSGLKYTQAVLNIGALGAKFDLGRTITDDDVGVVLGEIGIPGQTGEQINVYPTFNGVRVGAWARTVVPADYGINTKYWDKRFPKDQQQLQSFLTTFRRSDFTNDTGELTFDGIEISGNNGYDPNIVATIETLLPLYVPVTTNLFPVTGMTFSPGFVSNPEHNGQTLTDITVDGRTFNSITGLTCVAYSGGEWVAGTSNENIPEATSNISSVLSGLKFTQFAANPKSVDFNLGFTTTQNDKNLRFFFGDASPTHVLPDAATIRPLRDGVPIGNWKINVEVGDYGPMSPPWKINKLTTPMASCLVSFAITDFTSETAAPFLGEVTGFRVEDHSSTAPFVIDPNVFGVYVCPPLLLGTVILVQ